MKEVYEDEIRQRYTAKDMVRADCQGCIGCSDCCCGMGESIIVDPLDALHLEAGLSCTFGELLENHLELHVVEGLILPNLKMDEKTDRCTFLNTAGRCIIHAFRPGLCRLFPLGRIYEDGSYRYYLQRYECKNTNRSKIKVSKWLGIPELGKYEKYITDWHYLLKDIQAQICASQDEQFAKDISMYLLNAFYVEMFDKDETFYEQFEARYQKLRKLLKVLG